jgi:mRNA-degrading endonuclease RelE of RelBE toxin-antitoxin system
MYKIELRRLAQRTLDKLPKHDYEAVLIAVKALGGIPQAKRRRENKKRGIMAGQTG